MTSLRYDAVNCVKKQLVQAVRVLKIPMDMEGKNRTVTVYGNQTSIEEEY